MHGSIHHVGEGTYGGTLLRLSARTLQCTGLLVRSADLTPACCAGPACSLPGASPTVDMARMGSVPVGRTPKGGVSQPRIPSQSQVHPLPTLCAVLWYHGCVSACVASLRCYD